VSATQFSLGRKYHSTSASSSSVPTANRSFRSSPWPNSLAGLASAGVLMCCSRATLNFEVASWLRSSLVALSMAFPLARIFDRHVVSKPRTANPCLPFGHQVIRPFCLLSMWVFPYLTSYVLVDFFRHCLVRSRSTNTIFGFDASSFHNLGSVQPTPGSGLVLSSCPIANHKPVSEVQETIVCINASLTITRRLRSSLKWYQSQSASSTTRTWSSRCLPALKTSPT